MKTGLSPLLCVLLFMTPAWPENLPEAPSAHFVQHGPPLPHPELPPAHVADRTYWSWITVATISTVADAVSTHRCLAQGRSETNFLYGSHPSTGQLYGESAAILGGYAVLSYFIKKQNRGKEPSWAWQLVPAIFTGMHGVGAASNSGCL